VFLEGVSSRSPHWSVMCDKPFATIVVVYHWRRLACLWTVVVYYYGKISPELRGSVGVSASGRTSPRLGYRPRKIGYIYHKGALVVNGPRHSLSLIMTRNNMDSRCLKCFPRVS
jgi:hypothetical protein